MRIYHGPKSWNHTAERNAAAERLMGASSTHFNYADVFNPIKLLSMLRNADVINFYAGYTLWPIALQQHRLYRMLAATDVAWLKKSGKKVVLHFQGCEIRDRYHVLAQSVCAHCAIRDTYCSPVNSRNRRNQLHKAIALADAVTVSTPDLLPYIRGAHAHFIPKIAPDGVAAFAQNPDFNYPRLRVIHAPTDRSIKGTDVIENVLSRHPDKFELVLIEGMSREAVFEAATHAHLAVDQIRVGWYGNFAVEMMQRGLPVVSYIRKDLQDIVRPAVLPLIAADEHNFEKVMLNLHKDRERLKNSRSEGLNYIRNVHSPEAVGKRLLSIYASL